MYKGVVMYKPEDVLTEDGYEDYKMHLKTMEKSLFFILNHASDLHIGAHKQGMKHLETLWDMQRLLDCKFLLEGDGEQP